MITRRTEIRDERCNRLLAALLTMVLTGLLAGLAEAADEPTVLITGSNRGIGLELARQYAERGWNVIATARKPDAAEALKAIQAKQSNLVIVQLDVTDHDRIDELAAEYQGKPIDILINNAGIVSGTSLLDTPDGKISRYLA